MKIKKLRSVYTLTIVSILLFCLHTGEKPLQLKGTNVNITKNIVIVYNRVPKCGSSTMLSLLRCYSQKSGTFKYIHSYDFSHYSFTMNEQMRLEKRLLAASKSNKKKPIVFDQHFYFFPLGSNSTTVFWYINQIRDPIQFALSAFSYTRYRCLVENIQYICAGLGPELNLTMEECLSNGDPSRCLTRSYGVSSMIAFFCGQSSICDDSVKRVVTDEALNLAKTNIERYYIHIGVLEYMESSLELMEYILPSIFTGVTEAYRRDQTQQRVKTTSIEYRHHPSSKTIAILRGLLQPEYELYQFVLQRLVNNYQQAFGRMPTVTV